MRYKPYTLIAEIGNNHLGSMTKAKELIHAAKESGATLVKSQAFVGADIKGSMPSSFYEMCAFGFDEYVELMDWAEQFGVILFYSVFSPQLYRLNQMQPYMKLAGSQSVNLPAPAVAALDNSNLFVSVRQDSERPAFHKARMLHVSDYLTDKPHLEQIDVLTKHYGRQCGYSDHTVGVQACQTAVTFHGSKVIEKHFTLTRDLYFEGKQYRDAVHAALPSEFEQLAMTMEEHFRD